jgi:hypothetical protein
MTTTQTAATKPDTPGYNKHLRIEFTCDRNGRKLAHYAGLGLHRFRVSTSAAETWISQGLATETALHHKSTGNAR